jgi:hypothetical protein
LQIKTKRTFATIAAAAAVGLSIAASHASDITSPPSVDHVPTPARQLDLGMTVDEVSHRGRADEDDGV